MKCTSCGRPLLRPTLEVMTRSGPAAYGPVCARAAFPECFGRQCKDPRRLRARSSAWRPDAAQLDLFEVAA